MDSDCHKFFQWPLMEFVVFNVTMYMVAFVGACYRAKWLVRVSSALVFILAVLVLGFTVFGLVLSSKGDARVISGRGYEEYRLQDFSNWLQNWVEKSSHWNNIKSCIQDSNVCNELGVNSGNVVYKEFYKKKLSPIESGCCKPPTSCNFGYVNATNWISTAGNFSDMDCNRWNNEEDQLCYDCDSCKAGVLVGIQYDWYGMDFLFIMFVGINCLIVNIMFSETHMDMRASRKICPYESDWVSASKGKSYR